MATFRFAERLPVPALIPWVRAHWMLEVLPDAPETHHVPPDGSSTLVYPVMSGFPARLLLSGPWLRPLAVPIQPGDRFAGVRLQPGAVGSLLAIDPVVLRNASVPAAGLLGEVAAELEAAYAGVESVDAIPARIEPILLRLAQHGAPLDPVVQRAVERLTRSRGEVPIADLAAELGVSPRTLHRRFSKATALSPKQFARVRRLLEAAWVRTYGEESWARVAHSAGYADQPHLNREVADFTGLTPAAWGERLRATEHDQVAP